MPEWLPPALNTTALATFAAFVLWGVVKIAHFMGPKIVAFFEGHATLVKILGDNLNKQTDLIQRNVEMDNAILEKVSDHSGRLDNIDTTLDHHGQQLRVIAGKLGADPVLQIPSHGSVTMTPAVEVDDTGGVRPVMTIKKNESQ